MAKKVVLTLDGNAVGGLLGEAFGEDLTAAVGALDKEYAPAAAGCPAALRSCGLRIEHFFDAIVADPIDFSFGCPSRQ